MSARSALADLVTPASLNAVPVAICTCHTVYVNFDGQALTKA